MDFEGYIAEANGLVWKKARDFGDALLVDEGAVAAAEVFDEQVIVVDGEQCVSAREQRGLGVDVAFAGATDDVFARRQGDARQFGAVVSQGDLGLRDVHGWMFLTPMLWRASRESSQ